MMSRIDALVDRIDGRIDSVVETSNKQLNISIDALADKIDSRIDGVVGTLENTNQQLNDGLKAVLGTLQTSNKQLNSSMESRIGGVVDRIDTLEKKIWPKFVCLRFNL